MTKFEDNLSPYLTAVEQGSTPATPGSGNQKLFIRTSDHLLCYVNSSGTVTTVGGGMTNPMTTKGDVILGDTGGTPTRLGAGTSGYVLTSAGAAAFPTWSAAAGGSTELSYVEFTSPVTAAGTTEATATTVVTSAAVSYSGSQRIKVEFYAPYLLASSGASCFLVLYDGAGSIGKIGQVGNGVLVIGSNTGSRFLTPSNASHTYSIRAYDGNGTGSVGAGAGGSGNLMPGYIRITTA